MMKIIFTIILVLLTFSSFAYSQSKYKDPFESLLPEEVKEKEARENEVASQIEGLLPAMAVRGILWGGDFPQVIIDGEVYKPGDNLKGLDAKVFKIEKNEVFISYGEKIYRIKIKEKGEL